MQGNSGLIKKIKLHLEPDRLKRINDLKNKINTAMPFQLDEEINIFAKKILKNVYKNKYNYYPNDDV